MISPLQEILEDRQFPEGIAWKYRQFQANETVVHEGEVGRSLFIVKSGLLRVTARVVLDDERRVQPGICDLGEDDFFGELSLFDNQPRSASVTAITESELIEIDASKLIQYLEIHPEKGYRVLKILYKTLITRLRKANQRMEYLFSWGLKAHRIQEHL